MTATRRRAGTGSAAGASGAIRCLDNANHISPRGNEWVRLAIPLLRVEMRNPVMGCGEYRWLFGVKRIVTPLMREERAIELIALISRGCAATHVRNRRQPLSITSNNASAGTHRAATPRKYRSIGLDRPGLGIDDGRFGSDVRVK